MRVHLAPSLASPNPASTPLILPQHEFLTLMCLECHVATRPQLLPDPQFDPISALVFSITQDVPPEHPSPRDLKGGCVADRLLAFVFFAHQDYVVYIFSTHWITFSLLVSLHFLCSPLSLHFFLLISLHFLYSMHFLYLPLSSHFLYSPLSVNFLYSVLTI